MVCPLAAIAAAGMMLEELGEQTSAARVERAVMWVTANKLQSVAAGKMGCSTQEVGDLVVQAAEEASV